MSTVKIILVGKISSKGGILHSSNFKTSSKPTQAPVQVSDSEADLRTKTVFPVSSFEGKIQIWLPVQPYEQIQNASFSWQTFSSAPSAGCVTSPLLQPTSEILLLCFITVKEKL